MLQVMLEGPVAWIILGLPLFLLATLTVVAVFRSPRRVRETPAVLKNEQGYSQSVDLLTKEEPDEASIEMLQEKLKRVNKEGNLNVEAEVRMQIGDLMATNGDLTTACEHWQIARNLFDEINDVQSRLQADDKMRKNGCPSDWVLTDF